MDKSQENNDLSTLEDQETIVGSSDTTPNEPDNSSTPEKPKKKAKKKFSVKEMISRINIYLLIFIFIVVVAGLIVFIGYQRDQSGDEQEQLPTQQLTPEELARLSGGDTRIGDPQQLLTIESNAVFSGQVLVRENLDVAGTISVGGSLSLPGITVSGASSFDQIQANSLSVAGDTNIQGQFNVDGNLAVGGSGSFGGALSAPTIITDSLQLSGDLQVTRHINAGGPTPRVNSGGGIGSGGTVSISGTDTAGTVAINPGGGAGNGPLATVTFANAFNQTPHVVITPVGRSVNYFITRTTTGFTIHISGSLTTGNFAFDYIAID